MYSMEKSTRGKRQRPEFLCPFCAEDFDIVGLCCHIDEEHAIEARNGVCPVCAKRVGADLRRRRFRRGGSNLSFSILRKELREGNLQSYLGGSSFLVSSSRMEADPLLTSFMQKVVDEPSTVQPLPSDETTLMAAPSHEGLADRVFKQPPLSDEDLKEKAQDEKPAYKVALTSQFLQKIPSPTSKAVQQPGVIGEETC
ncbi:protein dehydration-induced [Sesamum angolense]|uniref:Protein dehydration-induced n=1 Tax=Sesamum angolense TaxID=2727404 RepID=A0AAE1X5G5_9LAMI|nr:protein dehydration-induced [Sesamum angolense]